jgi:hypothetical protein
MGTYRCWVFALACVFASLIGCSRTPESGSAGPDRAAPLRELGDLLRSAAPAPGRGPAKLADLNRFTSIFPLAYEAVKSGAVVVVWSAAMKGEGEVKGGGGEVIAYEKDSPASGGYVLLTSGEVKEMTADEFKSAPKAK